MSDELDFDTLDNASTISANSTSGKDKSQTNTIKTFGWITFGLAIFYFFGGIIGLFTNSMASSFARLPGQMGQSNEFVDAMSSAYSLSFYQSLFGVFISIALIIGGIGFATLKEWGRKLMFGGCLAAIFYNVFGVYVAMATMSAMENAFTDLAAVDPQAAQGAKAISGIFGGFGMLATIVFSLIPVVYLIIVAVIANKERTKRLMS